MRREQLGPDDVVHIGKFALWMDIETDRREKRLLGDRTSPSALEGTMVLDPDALLDMQRKSTVERDVAEDPPGSVPVVSPKVRAGIGRFVPVVLAFAAGAVRGWTSPSCTWT